MCILRKNTIDGDDDISPTNPEEIQNENLVTEHDTDHGEEEIVAVNEAQIARDRQLAEEMQALELERRNRERMRRFREHQKKSVLRPEPTFRGLGCRGKGYKKVRRYENANLFKDMPVIDGEDQFAELSIYDFVPHNVTALTQLLMHKENMQIWDRFIHLPEEKQEKFLEKHIHRLRSRDSNKPQKDGKESKLKST